MFKITKPAEMVAAAVWKQNADRALKFIDSLGDTTAQRTIFGDKLGKIRDSLREAPGSESTMPVILSTATS